MPTLNTLNDAQCKAAEASEKARKLFDGGGLHLFISPTGAKTWRLAYRFEGKPKTMSFGPYPDVTLAEARVKRDAAKATLRDGIDPMPSRASPWKGPMKSIGQGARTSQTAIGTMRGAALKCTFVPRSENCRCVTSTGPNYWKR